MTATLLSTKDGFQTVHAPVLFKFEKIGQLVEGVLVARGPVVIEDKETGDKKRVMQYVFDPRNGAGLIKCLGSADLDQKITAGHVGMAVRVQYVGEERMPNGMMRVFDVGAKRIESTVNGHGLEITDDDIPY